jgi:cyclase
MSPAPAARTAIGADLIEVADGVHAYIQPDGGWCLNNAGVIVSGGETALVDTAATTDRALALRETVATLAPRAVRTIVNTHSHGDHTFGNYVFEDAVVVGHEGCRAEMNIAGKHLCGLWPDTDWGPIEVRPPSLTFRDRATLHVGDLAAELIHLGPAHTTGDAVVWLPGPRVLFTGDVIMAGVTPFTMMGSISGSLATIDGLRELGPRVVVPGHGPVGGPELLDAAEAYLRWVSAVAAENAAQGLTPLEAARASSPHRFSDLLDAERLVPNLHRAYAEHEGARPGAVLDVGLMFGQMVEFHGGLPACRA